MLHDADMEQREDVACGTVNAHVQQRYRRTVLDRIDLHEEATKKQASIMGTDVSANRGDDTHRERSSAGVT